MDGPQNTNSIQDHVSVVQIAAQKLASAKLVRPASSKYDFIKVKVWLNDNQRYYVLSRFLISRTLTSIRVQQNQAVRIALNLKKFLVDDGHLDVEQQELESVLFAIMEEHGYGDEFIRRYKTLSRFHLARRPLVVLICGAPCSGKSTLAQKLAARMNLPNVLHTDTVYELLRTGSDSPLAQQPLWQRGDLSGPRLLQEFAREARIVRRGLEGDLAKTLRDGKAIIIEGQHLEPSMYLQELQGGLPATHAHTHAHTHTPHPSEEASTTPSASNADGPASWASGRGGDDASALGANASKDVGTSPPSSPPGAATVMLRLSELLGGSGPHGRRRTHAGESREEADELLRGGGGRGSMYRAWSDPQLRTAAIAEGPLQPIPVPATTAVEMWDTPEQGSVEAEGGHHQELGDDGGPILVPMVVQMQADDQLALLGDWVARRWHDGAPADAVERATQAVQVLVQHFGQYGEVGVPVFTVSMQGFSDALDAMHDYLLACIELALKEQQVL